MLVTSTLEILRVSCNKVIDRSVSVAIVGGGIAGLTSALALSNVGIGCTVFERHSEVEDIGAGIQLPPNATSLLSKLGIETEIHEQSSTPQKMLWLNGKNDAILASFDMGRSLERRFGVPYLQIYRPDLMRCLRNSVQNTSDINVHFDSPIQRLELSNDSVTLHSNGRDYETDLCIAADGTNSTVRRTLGLANATKQTLYGTAFRFVLEPSESTVDYLTSTTRVWLHEQFHVVLYPIKSNQLLNVVFAVKRVASTSDEDLHRQESNVNELRQSIKGCSAELERLLQAAEGMVMHKWPIVSMPPFQYTTENCRRVIFVGDSWHTYLPYAAQGAAQAIEDSFTIGQLLGNTDRRNLDDIQSAFMQKRIRRVRKVHSISNRNDSVYHMKGKFRCWVRNKLAKLAYSYTTKQLFQSNNMW